MHVENEQPLSHRRMSALRKIYGLQRVDKRPSDGINMNLLSLSRGAVHGYRNESRWAFHPLEQGQVARAEATTEAKGDLGYQDSPATRS
jgi:hypothetical protein